MCASLTRFDLGLAAAFTAIEIVALSAWLYTADPAVVLSPFNAITLIVLGVGLYAEHVVSRIQKN